MGKKREQSRNYVFFKEKIRVILRVYSELYYPSKTSDRISMKIVEIADMYTKCFKIVCLYFIFIERRNFIFCV